MARYAQVGPALVVRSVIARNGSGSAGASHHINDKFVTGPLTLPLPRSRFSASIRHCVSPGGGP